MQRHPSDFLHSSPYQLKTPMSDGEGGDRRRTLINDRTFQFRQWIGFQIGAGIVLASSWGVYNFFGHSLWMTVLIFIVTGSFVSFFISRKISGPLYRLCIHMEEFANGRPNKMRARKNDSFGQLIQAYNQQVDFVCELKSNNSSKQENIIPLKKTA